MKITRLRPLFIYCKGVVAGVAILALLAVLFVGPNQLVAVVTAVGEQLWNGGIPAGVSTQRAPLAGFGATEPLVIPAAAFVSDGVSEPGDWFFAFGSGYLNGDNAIGSVCLQAPVYFPANVKVFTLGATVVDENPAGTVLVSLFRVSNFTGVVDLLATLGTEGSFSSEEIQYVIADPVENGEVAYPNYAYFVGICLAQDTRLSSVHLYYASDVLLPAIIRH